MENANLAVSALMQMISNLEMTRGDPLKVAEALLASIAEAQTRLLPLLPLLPPHVSQQLMRAMVDRNTTLSAIHDDPPGNAEELGKEITALERAWRAELETAVGEIVTVVYGVE